MKWWHVPAVAAVAALALALTLALSASAFMTRQQPAPQSQYWGQGTGPMKPTGWMGRMMGVCPCMGWMWGAPQQPQPQQQAPTSEPDVEVVVFAGDFGFGRSRDSITSPGPEIRVKRGSLVKLTLVNVGKAVHVLTVVGVLRGDSGASPVFPGAQAGTPANPLTPGQSLTVYFVADRPGTYYYVCNVPGHVTAGMWGRFVVE
ncbi:MAG: multicopper oxidase domain-containing protein [Thaumarchaeota archaeon]|nr:multicopper oxidase domain-containing protein [Candidatus Calditenuaceae archaeon]MDW8187267.1 multicopper oxidase domain-containing protein [Nitrososphaerota archaeon]